MRQVGWSLLAKQADLKTTQLSQCHLERQDGLPMDIFRTLKNATLLWAQLWGMKRQQAALSEVSKKHNHLSYLE